jgi:hypothetical protein
LTPSAPPTTKDFAATTQFTWLLHLPSKRPCSAALALRSAPPPHAADYTSPTRSQAETGAPRPPIVRAGLLRITYGPRTVVVVAPPLRDDGVRVVGCARATPWR